MLFKLQQSKLFKHFSFFLIVVQTKAGKVRGSTDIGKVNEKKVLKYLNIPYAESPTGDLRFEKPVAKKSWKGNQ